MLIYEKENKLNINFDNEVNEQPDLQISKNGDKTEVLIDGQPGGSDGGSGGDMLTVNVTKQGEDSTYTYTCDKTAEEMYTAMQTGSIKLLIPDDNEITMVQIAYIESEYYHFVCQKYANVDDWFADFYAAGEDQYPSYFFSDK